MSKETYSPVETSVGFLRGRDAVYLDALHYDGSTLLLQGECNGRLASNTSARWIGYALTFTGVLAFQVVELDSWEHRCSQPVLMESSFWEVIDSKWKARLGGKAQPVHRHIVIQTYDDVVEVICASFEFTITRSE